MVIHHPWAEDGEHVSDVLVVATLQIHRPNRVLSTGLVLGTLGGDSWISSPEVVIFSVLVVIPVSCCPPRAKLLTAIGMKVTHITIRWDSKASSVRLSVQVLQCFSRPVLVVNVKAFSLGPGTGHGYTHRRGVQKGCNFHAFFAKLMPVTWRRGNIQVPGVHQLDSQLCPVYPVGAEQTSSLSSKGVEGAHSAVNAVEGLLAVEVTLHVLAAEITHHCKAVWHVVRLIEGGPHTQVYKGLLRHILSKGVAHMAQKLHDKDRSIFSFSPEEHCFEKKTIV
jgi:hypothetical protein